jgi:hypothetical protein
MFIVSPFVEHKETALSQGEIPQLIELSSDNGLASTFSSMSSSKFWMRMKKKYKKKKYMKEQWGFFFAFHNLSLWNCTFCHGYV